MLLGQADASKLLRRYKIPFVNSVVFNDGETDRMNINFPIALKVDSSEVIHKSELGLVELNIPDRQGMQKTIARFKTILGMHGIKDYRFMAQEMAAGNEIIIGMKRDKTFGPVIMFGIGGVFVEVLKDVSMRIAPLSRRDCIDMIEEIRSKKILEGYRGRPPANKDSIISMLLAVSRLSLENDSIAEIDLNPVIANEKNTLVVDARLIDV